MKHISKYIIESNSVPVFDPSKSEIRSDGKTLVGAIYSKDMKITDHAESYEEAVTMIERDCDKDDKLYFIRWNKIIKCWENATVEFYWQKGSSNEILVSSEGYSKTKETLKKTFDNDDVVLVVVGQEK